MLVTEISRQDQNFRIIPRSSNLDNAFNAKTLLTALPVSTAEVLKVHITFSLHVPHMLLQEDLHKYSLKDLLYGTENGTSHENETLF